MADGSKKMIQHIKVGDKVASWSHVGMPDEKEPLWYAWSVDNISAGVKEESTVKTIRGNMHHEYHKILVSDKELHVTWEHPLLVKDVSDNKWKWKQAKNIVPNDLMLLEDDSHSPVISNEIIYTPITTYNMDVEETDTYYANGLLAHNVDYTVAQANIQSNLEAQGVPTAQATSIAESASFFSFKNDFMRF